MTRHDFATKWGRRLLPPAHSLPRSGTVVMGFLVSRGNYLYDPITMLYAVLSPGGVAHTTGAWLCAAAITATSIAFAETVRRSRRNLFIVRCLFAVAAMLLMTHWADASHHSYSPVGVPVVVAVSMYRGPAGLLVPAAGAVAALLTTADQRSTIIEAAVVLVLACVLGWGISVYLSLRDRAIARQSALVERARVADAYHAGRTSVFTDDEGTADLVQRVGVLLSLHGSTIGRVVGDMKRRAAQDVFDTGAFLATVVSGWSTRRNRTPDLQRTVDVAVVGDAARVLLTPGQADHVAAVLDALEPMGAVSIRLQRGNPQRIDRSRVLAVGDRLIAIPAQRTTRTWAVSPLPVAAVMVALWMSQPAVGGLMEAPLVAVGFTIIGLLHAVRVHHLVTLDDRNAPRAVNEIVALFVAFAVACIPLAVHGPGNTKVVWPPAEGAAEFAVLVLMLARPHLPSWQRRVLPAYLLLFVGLDIASFATNFSWRNALAESMFVPGMFLVTAGLGEAIAAVSRDANAEHQAHANALADQAFLDGGASARRELIDQLTELELEFARHRGSMDDALAGEIQRRITDAERFTTMT